MTKLAERILKMAGVERENEIQRAIRLWKEDKKWEEQQECLEC